MKTRVPPKRWRGGRWLGFATHCLVFTSVALIGCVATMRIAIRSAEATVPSLKGLTVEQARQRAAKAHVEMEVENRYYSPDVTAGRVISQMPREGSIVRHEFQVHVTESLGPQKQPTPDVMGEVERVSTISIRRQGLELGSVAHTPWALQQAGTVIAQNPSPKSEAADRPRVSILVADPVPADQQGFVMPQFVGQRLETAKQAVAAAGLKIATTGAGSSGEGFTGIDEALQQAGSGSAGESPSSPVGDLTVTTPVTTSEALGRQSYPPGTITGQYPAAGARVDAQIPIRLAVAR